MSTLDDAPEANSEQFQESTAAPAAVSGDSIRRLQDAARTLIAELADIPDGDLVGQIVDNALKLLRDQTNRGDIKLINKSMKELRYALRIFAPYRTVRKVSIFGSARTKATDPHYVAAAEFGKQMAGFGWMVITGAGGGIMAAGHGGAGPAGSFGLSIRLPFEQATNEYIANDPKLINFKYFFTRKLMFLRASHAVAVFAGGFGTMDEAFEVLTLIQTGKSAPLPIVLVDEPGGTYWSSWQHYVKTELLARGLVSPSDLALYKITDSVANAVEEVRRYYRNFHSLRYSRNDLVLRLRFAPTATQLADITREFSDIKTRGEFRVSGALAVERDEPDLAELPRLVFAFNRRDHGRLRMLIDVLNDLPQAVEAGLCPDGTL